MTPRARDGRTIGAPAQANEGTGPVGGSPHRRRRVGNRAAAGETVRVGYNPYRKYRANPTDYVLVVLAVAAALGLVAWALLG